MPVQRVAEMVEDPVGRRRSTPRGYVFEQRADLRGSQLGDDDRPIAGFTWRSNSIEVSRVVRRLGSLACLAMNRSRTSLTILATSSFVGAAFAR